MLRRVTFRLYPKLAALQKLLYARRLHQYLYNAAIANRQTQYKRYSRSVSYFEQQNSLPAFKEVWPEYQELGSHALQATLKRVDLAYQSFFKGLRGKPKFKSIRRYSGWTYPDKAGWKIHTAGKNGYLELTDLKLSIQMRGEAKKWGLPTTCTIVYRHGKWYASVTVEVAAEDLKPQVLPTGAVGIDIGCQHALAITDGENHQLIDAPKFFRNAEQKIKQASKAKRRKRAPNKTKKIKASRRYKQAQSKVSKLTRKVANQRQNWVHQRAAEITSSNSFVATEKLEVKRMTRKAKTGKRKRQKAGLNKSILDVGFGMLRSAIKYKVEQIDGVFIEVPTKTIKPSQTCPKCGYQEKKTLDIRVHNCSNCHYVQGRDIAAAEVMLSWAKGNLPGFGTSLAGADGTSSTSSTRIRKDTGSFKQLAQRKRQKSLSTGLDAETQTSTK